MFSYFENNGKMLRDLLGDRHVKKVYPNSDLWLIEPSGCLAFSWPLGFYKKRYIILEDAFKTFKILYYIEELEDEVAELPINWVRTSHPFTWGIPKTLSFEQIQRDAFGDWDYMVYCSDKVIENPNEFRKIMIQSVLSPNKSKYISEKLPECDLPFLLISMHEDTLWLLGMIKNP
jgi:hypothetical protein